MVYGLKLSIGRKLLILDLDSIYAEKTWSVPKSRSIIQRIWVFGMCSVELRGASDTAEDKFSAFSAAQVANGLVEECVGDRSNLGGKKNVGPKKVFRVLVMHKDNQGPKLDNVAF